MNHVLQLLCATFALLSVHLEATSWGQVTEIDGTWQEDYANDTEKVNGWFKYSGGDDTEAVWTLSKGTDGTYFRFTKSDSANADKHQWMQRYFACKEASKVTVDLQLASCDALASGDHLRFYDLAINGTEAESAAYSELTFNNIDQQTTMADDGTLVDYYTGAAWTNQASQGCNAWSSYYSWSNTYVNVTIKDGSSTLESLAAGQVFQVTIKFKISNTNDFVHLWDTNITCVPLLTPTAAPTREPTTEPTIAPTTATPTESPTTAAPTTGSPTKSPTKAPTSDPTKAPTTDPTASPSDDPTMSPSTDPTKSPSTDPTKAPTTDPTVSPSNDPTVSPSEEPTSSPTTPTTDPTSAPTKATTASPTPDTDSPTTVPTADPTMSPTEDPTNSPTEYPTTAEPTTEPTEDPTMSPTTPTVSPTDLPSVSPTEMPTDGPSVEPTDEPSADPATAVTPAPTSSSGGGGLGAGGSSSGFDEVDWRSLALGAILASLFICCLFWILIFIFWKKRNESSVDETEMATTAGHP